MNFRSFFLIIMIMAGSLHAGATWEPFGPEGIRANKICFLLDNASHWGICHDHGIALYDHASQSWMDYPSNLPVMDAYYLNGNEFLVILGCGSYSDGVYTFNPQNGEFELVEFLECPNFIAYDEILQKYYIGHHSGLVTSSDGLVWNPVAGFNNMNIVSMAIYQNNIVLSQMDNIYSIWHSGDHGDSWTQSPAGVPMISDLCFDYNQKLFGIFPDQSYSSGLWSSDDFGWSWDVEFWSVNMSNVEIDAMGDVYVGWDENTMGSDEGIARYDMASGTYSFINDGLSSLVINDLCINPMMSAIALFCCTDSGAYITYDYLGMKENENPQRSGLLKVFPNPAKDVLHIVYILENLGRNATVQIFSSDGKMILESSFNKNKKQLNVNISGLSSGLYYIIVRKDNSFSSRRFIIR